jgi:hypothetical protein
MFECSAVLVDSTLEWMEEREIQVLVAFPCLLWMLVYSFIYGSSPSHPKLPPNIPAQ